MSSRAADLLTRHRVMRSKGQWGLPGSILRGRDLFIISINTKIRLEARKNALGVKAVVSGKLLSR